MSRKVAHLAAADRLYHEGSPLNGSTLPITSTTLSPSQCLVHLGVRLCTHKGQRNRSISRLRQGSLPSQWNTCLLVAELCAQECACVLELQHPRTVLVSERKRARIISEYMLRRAVGKDIRSRDVEVAKCCGGCA
jgi:hypothetical protein